jgi:hypothetical protein
LHRDFVSVNVCRSSYALWVRVCFVQPVVCAGYVSGVRSLLVSSGYERLETADIFVQFLVS